MHQILDVILMHVKWVEPYFYQHELYTYENTNQHIDHQSGHMSVHQGVGTVHKPSPRLHHQLDSSHKKK